MPPAVAWALPAISEVATICWAVAPAMATVCCATSPITPAIVSIAATAPFVSVSKAAICSGDLVGGLGGPARQQLDLAGDDAEAAPGLAGAGGLDRRVEREQIRLRRDIADQPDHPGDAARRLREIGDIDAGAGRVARRRPDHGIGLPDPPGDIGDRLRQLLRGGGDGAHIVGCVERGIARLACLRGRGRGDGVHAARRRLHLGRACANDVEKSFDPHVEIADELLAAWPDAAPAPHRVHWASASSLSRIRAWSRKTTTERAMSPISSRRDDSGTASTVSAFASLVMVFARLRKGFAKREMDRAPGHRQTEADQQEAADRLLAL